MDKILLTIPEVAQVTGLGRSLIYTKVMAGELRSVRIGRARRVPVAAITEFIEGLESEQKGDRGISRKDSEHDGRTGDLNG